MGQRLVIKMMDNSEENDGLLATGYYHWSGYTSSSFAILKSIIEEYETNEEEYKKDQFKDNRLNNLFKAIRLLESTGAGLINPQEASDLFNGYKFNECVSRNAGVIDISEEGMENALNWAEAIIEIHLDTETINFQVFSSWHYEDYYDQEIVWNFQMVKNEDDYREEDIKKINDYFENGLITEDTKKECLKNIDDGEHLAFEDPAVIHKPNFDWYNFSFEEIDIADEILKEIYDCDWYCFYMDNYPEEILTLIE